MNNILAAKVLMSHLPGITDGAYKTATEIAIEELLESAIADWKKYYKNEGNLPTREYLGLSESQYDYWILSKNRW